MAILVLPIAGVVLYLLLGETRISGPRKSRGKEIDSRLPRPPNNFECKAKTSGGAHWAPFALARTVNHLCPTTGNSARLAADSNAAVSEMVADIDVAKSTVHGCFYIWLADNNGLKLKEGFIRAARRGVQVRLLADALGSRRLIHSRHWSELRDGGCAVRVRRLHAALAILFMGGTLSIPGDAESDDDEPDSGFVRSLRGADRGAVFRSGRARARRAGRL